MPPGWLVSWLAGIFLVSTHELWKRPQHHLLSETVLYVKICLAINILQFLNWSAWLRKVWLQGLSVDTRKQWVVRKQLI